MSQLDELRKNMHNIWITTCDLSAVVAMARKKDIVTSDTLVVTHTCDQGVQALNFALRMTHFLNPPYLVVIRLPRAPRDVGSFSRLLKHKVYLVAP